jgi:hypothetical protein
VEIVSNVDKLYKESHIRDPLNLVDYQEAEELLQEHMVDLNVTLVSEIGKFNF